MVFSVLCSANLALASQTTPPVSNNTAIIGIAPVGNDLSLIDIGGFLRLLGGFFRIGVSPATTTTSQWPNASNTGYGNTTLTPAGFSTITSPGTYSGYSFSNGVEINSSNVTLSDCLINTSNSANWSIGVAGGLTNVTIDHCTIIGAGSNSTVTGAYSIYIQGDSQVTITNCDISLTADIHPSGGQITIEKNYIHDIASGPGTHLEDIGFEGNSSSDFSMLIEDNWIDNPNTQTAAIFLEAYFGALNNITIENNYLGGGSYTVYAIGTNAYDITNMSIMNNSMRIGSAVGFFDTYGHSGNQFQLTQTGNASYVSGYPIWSPDVTYAQNAIIEGYDGWLYKSLVNGNLNNYTPNGGGTNSYWSSSGLAGYEG